VNVLLKSNRGQKNIFLKSSNSFRRNKMRTILSVILISLIWNLLAIEASGSVTSAPLSEADARVLLVSAFRNRGRIRCYETVSYEQRGSHRIVKKTIVKNVSPRVQFRRIELGEVDSAGVAKNTTLIKGPAGFYRVSEGVVGQMADWAHVDYTPPLDVVWPEEQLPRDTAISTYTLDDSIDYYGISAYRIVVRLTDQIYREALLKLQGAKAGEAEVPMGTGRPRAMLASNLQYCGVYYIEKATNCFLMYESYNLLGEKVFYSGVHEFRVFDEVSNEYFLPNFSSSVR